MSLPCFKILNKNQVPGLVHLSSILRNCKFVVQVSKFDRKGFQNIAFPERFYTCILLCNFISNFHFDLKMEGRWILNKSRLSWFKIFFFLGLCESLVHVVTCMSSCCCTQPCKCFKFWHSHAIFVTFSYVPIQSPEKVLMHVREPLEEWHFKQMDHAVGLSFKFNFNFALVGHLLKGTDSISFCWMIKQRKGIMAVPLRDLLSSVHWGKYLVYKELQLMRKIFPV